MRSAKLGGVLCLLFSACTIDRFGDRHTEPVPPRREAAFTATAGSPGKWNTAETIGAPGFQTFRCEFPVPSVPQYTGQSIFFWCGVQQASGIGEHSDTSFGVLQPVLMFGPDCVEEADREKKIGPRHDASYPSNPYWYYSAQYIYPNPVGSKDYKCTTGRLFKATPGEILISTMTYNPVADVMTVRMETSRGSGVSVLTVAHPWNERSRSWKEFIGQDQIILEAALEIPHPEPPPPISPEFFSGLLVKASVTASPRYPFNGDEWQLIPHSANALSVSCNYRAASLSSDCTWSR